VTHHPATIENKLSGLRTVNWIPTLHKNIICTWHTNNICLYIDVWWILFILSYSILAIDDNIWSTKNVLLLCHSLIMWNGGLYTFVCVTACLTLLGPPVGRGPWELVYKRYQNEERGTHCMICKNITRVDTFFMKTKTCCLDGED
jgi:hypothetical protein